MGLSNQDVDVGSLSSTIVVGVAYNKDSVKSELEIDVSTLGGSYPWGECPLALLFQGSVVVVVVVVVVCCWLVSF